MLWATLLDALRLASDGAHPEFEARLAVLRPSTAPKAHAKFLAQVQRTLSDFGERVLLVIDDAHVIEGSDAEREFIEIVQNLPANVHFTFATRSPLQTQAARVSGRLIELTADSLSITRAETAELFARRGFEGSDTRAVL